MHHGRPCYFASRAGPCFCAVSRVGACQMMTSLWPSSVVPATASRVPSSEKSRSRSCPWAPSSEASSDMVKASQSSTSPDRTYACQDRCIGRKRHGSGQTAVAEESRHFVPRGAVEEPDRAISKPNGQDAAVRRIGQAARQAWQDGGSPACRHRRQVETVELSVPCRRGEHRSGGRKRNVAASLFPFHVEHRVTVVRSQTILTS